MTTSSNIQRLSRAAVVLTAALLVACVPPVTHAPTAAAASPCEEPSYLALRRQHPDSLSAREWERVQSLDRACTSTTTQARRSAHGMSDPTHGHWMAAGLGTVVMVAMMITMW